jgi:hypothetical protein
MMYPSVYSNMAGKSDLNSDVSEQHLYEASDNIQRYPKWVPLI